MARIQDLWGGRAAALIGRRAARITGFSGLAILGVALLAGAVRVLPWIVAPSVPLRVALPFVRALLAMGLEATLLSAPPIGWAVSAAILVERGEARALLALGLSPARIVRASIVPVLAFALLAGLSGMASGTEAAAPGRLARSLVEQSKRSCDGVRTPRAADVPFVGVTWLCFVDHPPRLTGSLPGGGGTFTSADLTISDDLRSLYFSDMRILLGETGGTRLHVERADVKGLSPWGRASSLRPLWRAVLLSGTVLMLSLLAAFVVLAGSISHRLAALLLGAFGPLAALLTLSRLEQGDHPAAVYWAVPLSGLVAGAFATLLVWIVSRWYPRVLPRDPSSARPT